MRTLALVFALATIAAPAAAQTQSTCPPGQACVVIQAQVEAPPVYAAQPQPVVQPQPVYAQPGQPVYAQPAYAQPGQPVYAQPQGQLVEVRRSRPRWGLIGGGIGLLAGGWVGNWITGLVGGAAYVFRSSVTGVGDYVDWSFVPVAGPFVDMAYAGGNFNDSQLMGMHLLWGVLQLGGLTMIILGAVLQEETVTMQYALGETGLRVAFTPYADTQGAGLHASLAGF